MFHFENMSSRYPFAHLNYRYGGGNEFSKYCGNNEFRYPGKETQNACQSEHYLYASSEQRHSGSVTSNGSEELDTFPQQSHLPSTGSCMHGKALPVTTFERGERHPSEMWYHFTDQAVLEHKDMERDQILQENIQTASDHVYWTNLGEMENICSSNGDFDAVRGDRKISYHPCGKDHLSKIKATRNDCNSYFETKDRKNFTEDRNDGAKPKKKRYRPFAAQRERERLMVMNAALKKLKMCLPFEQQKQKLSKKGILEMASLYIKYLSHTLERTDSISSVRTVNLNRHNYITQGSNYS